jgi:hypothetical protein
LIKAGDVGLETDIFNDEAHIGKKRKTSRYTGYTDAEWGGKTRGWAAAASRLDDIKWRLVLHAAVDKVDWAEEDGGEGEGGEGEFDPRSLVEL